MACIVSADTDLAVLYVKVTIDLSAQEGGIQTTGSPRPVRAQNDLAPKVLVGGLEAKTRAVSVRWVETGRRGLCGRP